MKKPRRGESREIKEPQTGKLRKAASASSDPRIRLLPAGICHHVRRRPISRLPPPAPPRPRQRRLPCSRLRVRSPCKLSAQSYNLRRECVGYVPIRRWNSVSGMGSFNSWELN